MREAERCPLMVHLQIVFQQLYVKRYLENANVWMI